jgi:NADPH:quinone reductase-like Zn-dependent oxidoreductase
MARIVRFHQYGDPSVLKIEDLDVPAPAADEVQIEVKSIGLNRAEVMFRTHAICKRLNFRVGSGTRLRVSSKPLGHP